MNHGDIVREALNFGYGGDPNYRPFYEDGITALDALLAEVERLTAERDEARAALASAKPLSQYVLERAEAAEALAERRGEALQQAIDDLEVIRADFPGTLRALEIEGNVKHYRAALSDEGQG